MKIHKITNENAKGQKIKKIMIVFSGLLLVLFLLSCFLALDLYSDTDYLFKEKVEKLAIKFEKKHKKEIEEGK